ncbi:MAG: hypothetical protein ACXWDL_01760 [Nocardioides sp.]
MAKGKKDKKLRKAGASPVAKLPKKKCCVTKVRCTRCPLRMLKEGTLPEGYTVKKRKLVKVGTAPTRAPGKKQKTAA